LALLVCLATGVGAAVALFISSHLDRQLKVSTDIIGYATFHAFNPTVYDDLYYLAVIAFPAVAFAVLYALVRIWRDMHWPLPSLARLDGDEAAPVPPRAADKRNAFSRAPSAAARVLIVGLVMGLIAAVARGDTQFRVARDTAAAAALYCALLAAVAYLCSRSTRGRHAGWWAQLGRANVIGATLALTGLLVASQVTQVYVSSDRSVHHYSWLPAWLAILAILVGVAVAGWGLRRAGDDPKALARLDAKVVLLVAVPVGLFLLLAFLPASATQFSAFETGQSLTTLRLVQHGAFPWRDFLTAHGVFEDAIQTQISSTVIQDSNWGLGAGYSLLFAPACFLTVYFLACRVLRRTWPFLVVLGLMFFDGGYAIVYLRFAFWPLVLILLAAVINQRRPWLAAVLGGVLVAQAVVSQETAYCIPAAGLAILGSDAYRVDWRRRQDRFRGFAMSFWTVVGGTVTTAALVLILVSQHALGDFIRFYTALVPGHILTGGIPHLPFTGYYRKEALIPIVAILATTALLGTKVWLRRSLSTVDWMLFAAAILEFLYYPKFLERADLHVGDAFATCVPVLILLTAAALDAVEPVVVRLWRARLPHGVFRYTVGGVAAAVVVLHAPISVGAVLAAAPAHFRLVTDSEPTISAMGYATPQAIDKSLLSDLDQFLHAYLKPGAALFDFTNEPGLLYYLLDFRPSNAYYEVSVAMRQVIQQDVIDKLKANPPLFVVMAQSELGLPEWDDVPNMVRHYDISRYLLVNYQPFAEVHGQVIYVNKQASVPDPASLNLALSSPLVRTDLPFRGLSCDWGYSPNYLSVTPSPRPPGRQATSVTLTRESPTSYVLTLPQGRRWADYGWLEMDAATPFTASQLQLQDLPPLPGEQRTVRFWTLNGSPNTYRFPIGACSQWPGYGSTPLHLTMTSGENIAALRLLP
jgi:hypothetical protein